MDEFITFVAGALVYEHLKLTFLGPWLMRAYGARLAFKTTVSAGVSGLPSADADLLSVGEGSICGGGCVFDHETAQQVGDKHRRFGP